MSHSSGLQIKCFSLSSSFSFCLSFIIIIFFNFATHKIKGKGTPQNTYGIKGQRFCLFSASSPSPSLAFCLQLLAVLTGVCLASFHSFSHWHWKRLQMPPKEDRIFPSAHFHKKHNK